MGDMLELGPRQDGLHADVGRLVEGHGFDLLVTVGPLGRHIAEGALGAGMRPAAVTHFPDVETLVGDLANLVQAGDTVLVKGSRAMELEKVVAAMGSLTGDGQRG